MDDLTTNRAAPPAADRPAPTAAPDEAAAFAEAMRLYASGDPNGALALVRPLVQRHPESLSARLLVARCAARLGAPAIALATAEEAAACDPTSWEAQVLVAQAAIPIDLETAQAAADRACALAPEQAATAEVRTEVRVAQHTAADEAAARRSGGGFGRRAKAPTVAVEPTPVVTPPGLPAALIAPEEPRPERPIRLPKALQGAIPEGEPEVPSAGGAPTPPVAPTRPPAIVVPTLDAGAPDDDLSPDGATRGTDSPAWSALLVVGTLTWVFLGFRYGVQVIGGPVGYAVFLVVVGLVVGFWRTRTAAGDRPQTP